MTDSDFAAADSAAVFDAEAERAIWARNAEIPLMIALGTNRADFRWDHPDTRQLVLRHVTWCHDLSATGRLVGAGPLGWGDAVAKPADALLVLSARSAADADEVLATDPLVQAGVRGYAVSGWLLNQGLVCTHAGLAADAGP